MLIDSLNQKLERARKNFNASSCTLYVSDPHWTDEYRLVAMAGVQKEETMYGFISPVSARRIIAEGGKEVFSTDARQNEQFHEPLLAVNHIPEELCSLFGDFGQREGVQSSARLTHVDGSGKREAIFFINFSTRTVFDKPLKDGIRFFFRDVVAALKGVQEQLIMQDVDWLAEAAEIASPSWPVANIDFSVLDTPDTYFNVVIEAVLKALRIPPGTGLGTIHLYNAEEHTLELHGSFGAIQHPHKAQKHLVGNGQGIVSWVALRNRALLIEELEKSDFKRVHVSLNDDVKSELAVPLEAEGELIGVMCLECTEPNRFLPRHVRSVWYAANKAAVAYMVHQHASMNRNPLKLCLQATVGGFGAHTSLQDMARLAKEYLKASYCDIWRYNPYTKQFDNRGATYEDLVPTVRPEGWTHCIQRLMCPIWISDIRDATRYSICHWEVDKWREGSPEDGRRIELDRATVSQGIRSVLGMPIAIGDDCVGVAWIKYRREGLECPKPALMSFALGFAAEAGLVLDSIQRREVDMKEKMIINDVGEQVTDGIKFRWESEKSDFLLDICVISEPFHSKLGGDFYAKKVLDKATIGVILIDGEGHGVEGSLHMLPLMTAFESYWQSYSTAHVISQLTKISEAVGVRGSAIYCIFSLIEDKRWLCVTSAGHESLIIFKPLGRGRWSVRYHPDSHGPSFGNPLKEPLIDHRLELSEGDIVVGYTDGLAERGIGFDAIHVVTTVLDFLGKQGDTPADINVLAETLMQLSREQQKGGFRDDATIFVARVK